MIAWSIICLFPETRFKGFRGYTAFLCGTSCEILINTNVLLHHFSLVCMRLVSAGANCVTLRIKKRALTPSNFSLSAFWKGNRAPAPECYTASERGKGLNYFWLINERRLSARTMGFGRRQFFLFSTCKQKTTRRVKWPTVRHYICQVLCGERKSGTQYWKCRPAPWWKCDPGASS